MHKLIRKKLPPDLPAGDIVDRILARGEETKTAVFDSCGARHLGSRFLIAATEPSRVLELAGDPGESLARLEGALADDGRFCALTFSYDFGHSLLGLGDTRPATGEPDIYAAFFDAVLVHDYDSGETTVAGNGAAAEKLEALVTGPAGPPAGTFSATLRADLSRDEYLERIESVKELIRSGLTYQTNLTIGFDAELSRAGAAPEIFRRIRNDHPAPFAAFLARPRSTVVSASPERFFRIVGGGRDRTVSASPIKGTRPRGADAASDTLLLGELANSEKDRAENVMIVDLLRNDLGRVCEFGSVAVEKLCEIESHPTVFHLVSTITGKLRPGAGYREIVRALFPCGSITGAPKISTMRIIAANEPRRRGLSMGAIGFRAPAGWLRAGEPAVLDLAVAIRTMVVEGRRARFNVGGGIVADSDPESEFREALTKARVLVAALGIDAEPFFRELFGSRGV